uniref:Uncharacterized protein n=1 Tax=Schistocephalus solidus TaxID=70667 RepID=A0A0X3P820_SCHSO
MTSDDSVASPAHTFAQADPRCGPDSTSNWTNALSANVVKCSQLPKVLAEVVLVTRLTTCAPGYVELQPTIPQNGLMVATANWLEIGDKVLLSSSSKFTNNYLHFTANLPV